jgi:hypothetical protein
MADQTMVAEYDAEQAAVMTLRSDSSFGEIASALKSIAELVPQ